MLIRRIFFTVLTAANFAHPLHAGVVVSIADGNPYDRIWIQSQLGCETIIGELTIDFTTSAGSIIIDTLRGGPGTKDPMPVEVEKGQIRVLPVEDGAQTITIQIGHLTPGETAIVTLDFDDLKGWWPGPRVEVFGEEIEGSFAVLKLSDRAMQARFNARGTAVLPWPRAEDCQNTDPPVTTVPIS